MRLPLQDGHRSEHSKTACPGDITAYYITDLPPLPLTHGAGATGHPLQNATADQIQIQQWSGVASGAYTPRWCLDTPGDGGKQDNGPFPRRS